MEEKSEALGAGEYLPHQYELKRQLVALVAEFEKQTGVKVARVEALRATGGRGSDVKIYLAE